MDTLLALTTRLTTIAALVLVIQAVPTGKAFAATPARSEAEIEAARQRSEASNQLADYQPPPDTGKPKDSSGAGGRS